jgi:hypothetical protein
MARISITHLPGINYIVVKKGSSKDTFFYSNDYSFAMPIQRLSAILKHMVLSGFVSPKVLEGILEEYYSNGS